MPTDSECCASLVVAAFAVCLQKKHSRMNASIHLECLFHKRMAHCYAHYLFENILAAETRINWAFLKIFAYYLFLTEGCQGPRRQQAQVIFSLHERQISSMNYSVTLQIYQTSSPSNPHRLYSSSGLEELSRFPETVTKSAPIHFSLLSKAVTIFLPKPLFL